MKFKYKMKEIYKKIAHLFKKKKKRVEKKTCLGDITQSNDHFSLPWP